jgi:hypothetical protein
MTCLRYCSSPVSTCVYNFSTPNTNQSISIDVTKYRNQFYISKETYVHTHKTAVSVTSLRNSSSTRSAPTTCGYQWTLPLKYSTVKYKLFTEVNLLHYRVALGGLVVTMVSTGPRFACPNPDEDDGILRAIKVRIMTSFGGEIQPSVPCRKILRHAKDSYISAKFAAIFRQFLLLLLLGVCDIFFQRALLYELGMIRN